MEKNTILEQVGDGWVRWPQSKVKEPWEVAFDKYFSAAGMIRIEEFAWARKAFKAGWDSKQ